MRRANLADWQEHPSLEGWIGPPFELRVCPPKPHPKEGQLKLLRRHLSFSNVIASLALFVALGGSAYAVSAQSVGTQELKNSAVTAAKLRNNAVTSTKIRANAVTPRNIRNGAVRRNKIARGAIGPAKIANGAVNAAKIRNGAITGQKIASGAVDGSKIALNTLGTVPSAENADRAQTAAKAERLVGQENFYLKMRVGEEQTIAEHGAVSLYARCFDDDDGYRNIAIYGRTTVDGAILVADKNLRGRSPSNFLDVDTLETDRIWEINYTETTDTNVDHETGSGFILGPDGKGIVGNSDGIVMGINYAGADCITAGLLNKIG